MRDPVSDPTRRLQILCAVLESTSRELLPARYRDLDRAEIQARVNAIKLELRIG